MLKKIVHNFLKLLGIRVSRLDGRYHEDGLQTVHSDNFRSRPEFKAAYLSGLKSLNPNSSSQSNNQWVSQWNGEYVPGAYGQWRVHIALWCASVAAKVEGDFVECGVFVGFMSSSVMSALNWNETGKTFYLIDSFEGPSIDQFNDAERNGGRVEEVNNLRKIGGYDYSLEVVKKTFLKWKNVEFIKGFVPEALQKCPATQVAFLHLDMNCALPEVEALRFFWDKIPRGGVVLMDDYAFFGFEEQHTALNLVAKELGVQIASLPTGQGLIIKT